MRRLLVLLPLLLTAVCVAPLAGQASARSAHDVTTITFMSYTWPGQTGLQKVFARFEKLHPSIKVKQLWLGGSTYWQKVETQAVAGQPPDVFLNDPGFMEEFANKGLLLPLDNYFKRDKISLNQFYAPAVAQARWSPASLGVGKGPLMSFPWDYQAGLFVYNKTAFEQAHVPLPRPGWTWADVLADAKKLTKRDASGKVTQYGILAPSDFTHDLLLLTFAMGGRYYTPDFKKIDLLNPGFKKAMQLSHDLIWKYKVAPSPPPSGSQVDLFMTGKVAMWSTGTWQLFPYQQIKTFQWDVAPIPKGSPAMPSINWGASDEFSISKGSKNPNAAWELLKFLVAPGEGQKMIATLRIEPPVVKAYSTMYYSFHPPAHISLIPQSLENARPQPDMLGWGHISDPFTKGIQQILLSPSPIEPTLKSTQQAMQAILDQQWQQLGSH
jgi:multiple sugar transport system substrate-binding protein